MSKYDQQPQPSPKEETSDSKREKRFGIRSKIAAGLALAALLAGGSTAAKALSGNSREIPAKGPGMAAPAHSSPEASSPTSHEIHPSSQLHFEVMGKTYDAMNETTIDKIADDLAIPSGLTPAKKNDKLLQDFNILINTRGTEIRKKVLFPAAKKALAGETGSDADGMLSPAELLSSVENLSRDTSGLVLAIDTEADREGIDMFPSETQTDVNVSLTVRKADDSHDLVGKKLLHYVLETHGDTDKLIGGRMDDLPE